jgi:hypothetical protein
MSARHQTQKPNTTSGGVVTACTRFNNKTWQEYQDWKTKNQSAYEQIYQRPLKCIYGSPRELSHTKMPPHVKILVIEMNNDENQIKGIGVIQNQTASEVYRTPRPPSVTPPRPPTVTSVPDLPPPVPDLPPPQPSRIIFNHLFSNRNYTRYIYIGNEYYATREELERNHTADAQYINEQLTRLITPTITTLFQSLERLLFKGAKHMKRGTGITLCSVAPLLSCSIAPHGKAVLRDSATSR